jgi:hypothetical protein
MLAAAAAALAETPTAEIASPLVATPISPPNPVLGADARRHLVYEILLVDIGGSAIAIDKIEVLDGDQSQDSKGSMLRSRAQNLGTIKAPDAKAAEAEAVKLFGLTEEQQQALGGVRGFLRLGTHAALNAGQAAIIRSTARDNVRSFVLGTGIYRRIGPRSSIEPRESHSQHSECEDCSQDGVCPHPPVECALIFRRQPLILLR